MDRRSQPPAAYGQYVGESRRFYLDRARRWGWASGAKSARVLHFGRSSGTASALRAAKRSEREPKAGYTTACNRLSRATTPLEQSGGVHFPATLEIQLWY